uniref:Uncharacterized protein n=1 Tax=Parascaris equorum TaxID=6256 RepID=A0A914R3M9_PAREQ
MRPIDEPPPPYEVRGIYQDRLLTVGHYDHCRKSTTNNNSA